MGIPKYHKWLEERYPNAFSTGATLQCDHVYVDINAMLHEVARRAKRRDDFLNLLFQRLDQLFKLVRPTRSCYLAVDGPASFAKTMTQRQRRRERQAKESNSGKGGQMGKGGASSGEVSSNMITPGVRFMADLSEALEYYVLDRLGQGKPLSGSTAGSVSGVQAIGEGEHKIVSQLLRNAGVAAGRQEQHVVVSGDADLFLLTLMQFAARNVVVVSDVQHGRGQRSLTLWSTKLLGERLRTELPRAASAPAEEQSLRRDFCLCSLFSGNDYLPALASSLPPKKLWETYLELRRSRFAKQPLVVSWAAEDGEPIPPSHQSGGWAEAVGDGGGAFIAEFYERLGFCVSFLVELMRKAAQGRPAPKVKDGKTGVAEYMKGLLWVLEMYRHGYCPDFYYIFRKDFNPCAAPSLIVQHAAALEDVLVAPRSEYPPMRPLTCGVALLPVDAAEKYILPSTPKLQPLFREDNAVLGHVARFERDMELKKVRAQFAPLQRQLEQANASGDTNWASKLRAQLAQANERMASLKSSHTDIDTVVPWDLDAEVERLCGEHPMLDFSGEISYVRGVGPDFVAPKPPIARLPTLRVKGMRREVGEWPRQKGVPGAGQKRTRAASATSDEPQAKRPRLPDVAPPPEAYEQEGEEVSLDWEEEAPEEEDEEVNLDWEEEAPQEEDEEVNLDLEEEATSGEAVEESHAPTTQHAQNPIQQLHETLQTLGCTIPAYKFEPDPETGGFWCTCSTSDGIETFGHGANKKDAKKASASEMLEAFS